MKRVYVVGTQDTKGEELAYLTAEIAAAGAAATRGRRRHAAIVRGARITQARWRLPSARRRAVPARQDRGAAVAAMGEAFRPLHPVARRHRRHDRHRRRRRHLDRHRRHARAADRLPKLMVSTLASGDTRRLRRGQRHRHDAPVTDIAGLNRISRAVLSQRRQRHRRHGAQRARGGGRQAGDRAHHVRGDDAGVTQAVEMLKDDYDCLVFHATGTGGRAMEKLDRQRPRRGRHRRHHDRSRRPHRRRRDERRRGPPRRGRADAGALCRLARRGRHGQLLGAGHRCRSLPRPQAAPAQSTGDADAHDGGGKPRHRRVDRGAAQSLRGAGAPPDPGKGVSAMDGPRVSRSTIRKPTRRCSRHRGVLRQTDRRRLIRLPLHINDPAFSAALVENFREIAT
jgi:uncharacterized protein (UPF0261 family)